MRFSSELDPKTPRGNRTGVKPLAEELLGSVVEVEALLAELGVVVELVAAGGVGAPAEAEAIAEAALFAAMRKRPGSFRVIVQRTSVSIRPRIARERVVLSITSRPAWACLSW